MIDSQNPMPQSSLQAVSSAQAGAIGATGANGAASTKRTLQMEQTAAQTDGNAAWGLPGLSAAALEGFQPPPPGTYDLYRRISAHPTNALARGIVYSPILAGTWRWTRRDADVPERWLDLARDSIDPLRPQLLADALRALEFGWAGFEKIWTLRNGRMVLQRLKPLRWDYTQVLVDANGNAAGLRNQPPGSAAVTLPAAKMFLFSHDGEAGDPYGRSRHENIRQVWGEAEQIRQRLAQYMKKVSGIVVQLHYPEGTSRDGAGAERPNQWLGQQVLDAVSAGRSVMFPNGFASTNDLRMAYELAGKSQWALSSVDTGGSDLAPGFRQILDYYDALIFRGWLRPERSGLQAEHGSRADARVHTDTAALDSQLIDQQLSAAVSRGIVDDLLELNFGPAARGAVRVESPPAQQQGVDLYESIADRLLAGSSGGSVAARIDIDRLLQLLEIPVKTVQ